MTGKADDVNGLFTALITPFTSSGEVDTEKLTSLVDFQISKGVSGIYPCGSTGLGPMLTLDERKMVAETVIDAAGTRATIVVQVGSADTTSSVELAKHAESLGVYAVASLTPYYYKQAKAETVKHFETISSAVSIPVLAYNIPHFTGNNLEPQVVAELAGAGTIAGIKDSSRNFLQLLELLSAAPEGFVVMNGIEEYGLFAIESGADGLVSGGASAIPELFVSMVSAQAKGDFRQALEAQATIQKVKELVRPAPIPAYYEILRARGIDCGSPRAPFLPMEKGEASSMIAGLKRLGLV